MALVLTSIYNFYHWIFNEYKDPRLENYPMTGSPLPIIGLCIVYVYFVTEWGPKFMKNRSPYDLSNVIKVYNLIQILVNLFVGLYGGYYSYWLGTVAISCGAIDPTDNSYAMRQVIVATYIYYISKIIDLLDTVFFVLRKKDSQISFLHVYHHGCMVLGVYTHTKYLSGSHSSMLGIINAFVHVIMYSYYFLTSYRPELRNSLWWKKHITQIQLFQFGILVLHFMNPIFFHDCAWPTAMSFIGVIQNLFMFVLFLDFYIKAYVRKTKIN